MFSVGCGTELSENHVDPTLTAENRDYKPVPIAMVPIVQPGEHAMFLMGSTSEEIEQQPTMDHVDFITDDEQPAHQVTLTTAYAMSKFEITNDQYCQVMNRALDEGYAHIKDGDLVGADGKKYLGIAHLVDDKNLGVQYGIRIVEGRLAPNEGLGNHPVHAVTWYGSVAFCQFLSVQEGFEPAYDLKSWTWDPQKRGYHLPTEAEWEYAARKDHRQTYAWGDSISTSHLNFWASVESRGFPPFTVPVGYYDGTEKEGLITEDNASPFGLYDMTGNVWEWCWDWYGRNYYATSPALDPRGPETGDDRPPYDVDVPTKVWRGCGWAGNEAFSRIAKRWSSSPGTAINETGFRIARGL